MGRRPAADRLAAIQHQIPGLVEEVLGMEVIDLRLPIPLQVLPEQRDEVADVQGDVRPTLDLAQV